MDPQNIYLDNAATTNTDPKVVKTMLPYFQEIYANPSSLHDPGRQAKVALDQARKSIASNLNCAPHELIFTSGGTESNNLALIGYALANKDKGNHIITTNIEHPSIFEALKYLSKNEGFNITFLNVDRDGFIDSNELKDAITDQTVLISIIYANNEIGTIQDIPKIAKLAKINKIPLHIDACQATNYISLDAQTLDIDMMTINSSKAHGPKGIGALYLKEGIKIQPLTLGGPQENNMRAGTENLAGIIGFAAALDIAQKDKDQEYAKVKSLTEILENQILEKIPGSVLNSTAKNRLPNILNISFPNLEGKELLLYLDNFGIAVSTGSACKSGDNRSSHVLRAIGIQDQEAKKSIRFSLGKLNTHQEIDYTIKILIQIFTKLFN